ncbi:hypothetical protein DL93DRAFT_2081371 [Clavulina sp. PMI_390]|nr:hypothetical protein DL93DRAFT_2081371 [Clavulina sp. PMI_390]
MARTKQTARKQCGGRAPHRKIRERWRRGTDHLYRSRMKSKPKLYRSQSPSSSMWGEGNVEPKDLSEPETEQAE